MGIGLRMGVAMGMAMAAAAVASKQQQQQEEQQQQQCAAIKCQTGAFDGRLKSLQLSAPVSSVRVPPVRVSLCAVTERSHTHTPTHTRTHVWHLKCTPINKSANKAINMQKETSERVEAYSM